ncbi:MAG TPA: glycosyltransferase family 4 protein [Patescibacteria group bacterium]|jgi:glycosyltransferase involved in cell wall biosynthesis|nr:glycosyltransferase family 4 protein [Patescibacteria group bacterium]
MQAKTRILAWGDYACATGFAKVMSEIMRNLEATGRYEIDVVGINYDGGPYDRDRFPGNVWPALSGIRNGGVYGDVFGRQVLLDRIASKPYDVIFALQDTFIVQQFMKQLLDQIAGNPSKPKLVYYFPIDAEPKHDWIEDVVAKIDFPVTYTNYAKQECLKFKPELKDKIKVIYHGTNTADFYPIDNIAQKKAFREQYFNFKADGKFLITNVNRNQSRKDIARNFAILRELKDRGHDNVMLYMHMAHNDVGGNLLVMADNWDLKFGTDFMFPAPNAFSPDKGLSVDIINMIYNVSNCVLSTTLGEGWGLSITEGMATRTPVIAPDNTSVAEILAEHRGLLIPCGGKSLWITKESDNERVRPLADVEKAADLIEGLINGVGPDVNAAYAWAKQHSWASITEQWIKVIEKAASAAQEDREPKLNREQRRANRKLQNQRLSYAGV